MGPFSNNTEFCEFQSRICRTCVHIDTHDAESDTYSCPILDGYIMADLKGEGVEGFTKAILEIDPSGVYIVGCRMRIEKPFHDPDQLALFDEGGMG